MVGKIVNITTREKRAGGIYYRVEVVSDAQPDKTLEYNCFDSAIAGLAGNTVEYTATPPKVGTVPILRLTGAMREPFGGRTVERTLAVKPTIGGERKSPSARTESRNESFACSYAKDITIALIEQSPETLTVEQVDFYLDHYFEWFMLRLKSTEEAPF